jgi:hypothetical protein
MYSSQDLVGVLTGFSISDEKAQLELDQFTDIQSNASSTMLNTTYRLPDINSRDKYLVAEHAEQFWPKYSALAKGLKLPQPTRNALDVGFAELAITPTLNEVNENTLNHTARRLVAGDLGLIIISRVTAGFEETFPIYPHMGTRQKRNNRAIQVGSFIDFAHGVVDHIFDVLPAGFGAQETRLVAAFAILLESQIDNEHAEM